MTLDLFTDMQELKDLRIYYIDRYLSATTSRQIAIYEKTLRQIQKEMLKLEIKNKTSESSKLSKFQEGLLEDLEN